mmetsp:Transcript_16175/g.43477  ORF Transcript_16175/g.43477 Transcript_16175/m.43477 type:complete len:158 (+) Transcript_16175:1797-2270(+)
MLSPLGRVHQRGVGSEFGRCPRRYLLGRKFPGQRIGPEPTTDRFTAVMYGEDDRTIPGNALTVAPNSPFRALQREGNAFLSRFEGSLCAAPLLEHLSLIDTPGVLSGEKQRVQRHYDFDVVVQWRRRGVYQVAAMASSRYRIASTPSTRPAERRRVS